MLMNTAIFEECPQIAAAIIKRGDEIVGHGRTNAERQGQMPEDEERRLIEEVVTTCGEKTGVAPAGWLGPWVSESLCYARSPAGGRFHLSHGLDAGRPAGVDEDHARAAFSPFPTSGRPTICR